MATQVQSISIEEFCRSYSNQKPAYEYWAGEAIQKAMPTRLHGMLQFLLMKLLDEAGWTPTPETRLKVVPDYWPVPDIVADHGKVDGQYPHIAPELCIEILSPDDRFIHILDKAQRYIEWGTQTVWIIDPIARVAWIMAAANSQGVASQWMVTAEGILTAGATQIKMQTLFDLVDSRVNSNN